MKMHLSITIFVSLSLTSCLVIEPFAFLNSTNGIVIIETENRSYSIEPNKTKKIKGLHYSGGSITYSSGSKKTYHDSLKGLHSNWETLRGKYICDGFWSAEFHVVITTSETLLLQPCSDEEKSLVLEPDNA